MAASHALAQGDARVQALGAFDQIAIACARGGTEAVVDRYRLKLWHAYLGARADTDEDIEDMMVSLRKEILDDVTDDLRRQYKSARAAIPETRSLGGADQDEFYKLCESPTVRGLPDRR